MSDIQGLSDQELLDLANKWTIRARPTGEVLPPSQQQTPAPAGPIQQLSDEDLVAQFRALSPREKGKQTAIREGGIMDAIPMALTTGVLGNLPDYPPAAFAGVKGLLKGEGFSQPFDNELEWQRGAREGLQQKYPITTLTGNIGGAVAPGAAIAKLITAPSLLGRMWQSLYTGAGLGFAQGAAQGEGVKDRLLVQGPWGGAIGAVAGPVGEVGATAAGALWRKAFGANRNPAPGVVAGERQALADELGIPLTAGQNTGNVTQQAFENSARNDAKGVVAGNIVRGFDQRQAGAVRGAKENIGNQLSPIAAEAPEAANAVTTALRNEANNLRTQSNAAYEAASNKNAWIAADEVTKLGQNVSRQLEQEGIRLDTYGNYPGSQAAMTLLRRVAGFEGSPQGQGEVVAQSLQGLEQVRKALLKVKPGNAEDMRALIAIRQSFDDWISDAIDKRLFAGDPTALDDLLKARSLWAQYKGLTAPREGDGKKLIAKIINEERSGEEVANWLLSAKTVNQASLAARAANEIRKTLGANSEEMQGLKFALWNKVANPTRGEGPQAVANSIRDFTRGPGAPLARTIFGKEEIALMHKYETVLRYLIPDPRSTNRGQSGYELLRGVMTGAGATTMAGGVATAVATGDPKYAAISALPLLRNASVVSRAFSAIRPNESAVAQPMRQLLRAPTLAAPEQPFQR